MPQNQTRASTPLWTDLALVAFLIAFDVVARLLPHVPGFMPVAASALFAGRMLRIPFLALVVPVAAMALSSPLLGAEDWRVLLVVYAALALPALAGMGLRRHSSAALTVAAMIVCSLVFFAASNFAVWAFGGLYPHTMDGLAQCYVAALPFLDKTVMGDLFWTAVLFGGAWLVQRAPMLRRAS
ncbi:MAG TPA: DUF6580 family putative transport protein [Pseudolabrys sp.]|nr:DUF6580 family putative transport protein [Pseudolabrys sp.]